MDLRSKNFNVVPEVQGHFYRFDAETVAAARNVINNVPKFFVNSVYHYHQLECTLSEVILDAPAKVFKGPNRKRR